MESDGELLDAAASGDQSAWNALVERHSQLVYANARAVGADDATAKDISQVVWMRLLSRLGTEKQPEKLRGWLAIVARNATRDEHRRKKPQASLDAVLHLADESVRDPDEALIGADRASVLGAALKQISERCRELLTMLYSADMSYDEISEATGTPKGSIGPTRQRCLSALKKFIDPEAVI